MDNKNYALSDASILNKYQDLKTKFESDAADIIQSKKDLEFNGYVDFRSDFGSTGFEDFTFDLTEGITAKVKSTSKTWPGGAPVTKYFDRGKTTLIKLVPNTYRVFITSGMTSRRPMVYLYSGNTWYYLIDETQSKKIIGLARKGTSNGGELKVKINM